jgi:hypothetical protein
MQIYLYISLTLLFISVFVILFLAIKAKKINKQIKVLNDVRQSDILETNKMFIEKSENELKLFFQFETVLEELFKMTKKHDKVSMDMIKSLQEIRLLMDYQFKKE